MSGNAGQTLHTDDGVALWHVRGGAGAPLILCHGGPGLWDYLEPLARSIEDVVEVHRWDQRGGGRSARRGPYSIARMVEDMEVIRRHVGLERWVVAGHSWGAELALHYAVAHPERTRALVYVSGRGLMDSWRARNQGEARRREELARTGQQRQRLDVLARLHHRPPALEREFRLLSWAPDVSPGFDAESLLRDMIDAPYEPNLEANAALGEDNRAATPALRQALATLVLPVLLVHGSHDPRPVDGAEELAALLPDARLEVVHGGHSPWLEEPEATSRLLTEFLRSLAP